jgi:HD-GYP domain-containing protein (c-di-GMP phosphodiesterase class II)
LAKLLGLKGNILFQIRFAGLLHAIGKISFKDSSLYKFPHEMTKAEYQQYVLYPRIGVEILNNHKSFETISKIIYQHTERIDGTGFPEGESGDDIHPGARIIAVVDTYHNMVYKKTRDAGRGIDKSSTFTNTQAFLNASKDRHSGAIKYLEQKRNSYFDARVVDAFIVMIEHERSDLSDKQILRVPVNKIENGMIFAQDYHTSYGLLIASRGEKVTDNMMKPLIRFAENQEIPHKILMLA